MNIFLREMKANRKALIIWSVCMFLLVMSGMAKYTAYSSGGESAALFNDLPYSVKALLGMGSFDVTTLSGYFAMLFLYIELAAAIHAALLGAGIISKEERDKTAEFLMIKPVSRSSVITSKLLAAFINILTVNIVIAASSVAMTAAYNKGEDISGEIILFMLSMFFVQLIFLSLGAATAAFTKNSKLSGSITMGMLLIAFIISKITDLTDRLNVLNVLSPFKYFSYADLVGGKGLNIAVVVLSLLLTAAFAASAYFFYPKRDLSI
ncbi:MAG: ABC transporter permease subunit [Oscillospiraceae bacterium]|nr:ABC transporter permease subunit [Oscillospiraceae bacterium]